MQRRHFARHALGLAGALALAGTALPRRARAAGFEPAEGHDFVELDKPVAVPANGKIEVIEFFWYGCPHCFAFEPSLESWTARLPADVQFSRAPVAFDARKELHQRIYYTWEAMGLIDEMHLKTFTRFHLEHKPIDSLGELLSFAQRNGLDATKVRAVWDSFSVQSKCAAARRLEDAYGIERTPEMAVGGRFVASAQPEYGPAGLLMTTDRLVERIRRRR